MFILSVSIIFCSLFYITRRGTHINTKKLEAFIEKVDSEKEETVANAFFGILYFDESELYLDDCINDTKHEIRQVFCINNDKIYFLCQYKDDENIHWCILSTDLDGRNLKKHTDDVFSGRYNVSVSTPYQARNGYYYDEKIIITDFEKLVEFNIKSSTVTTYNYEQYQYLQYTISWDIENHQKVIFHTSENDIIITKESFAESNIVAKELIGSFDKKIWSEKSSLYSLFDSVQIVDNEVYLICRVLNYRGSTYAMVFHCDLDKQEYKYCLTYFTGDIINENEFYIVPRK